MTEVDDGTAEMLREAVGPFTWLKPVIFFISDLLNAPEKSKKMILTMLPALSS